MVWLWHWVPYGAGKTVCWSICRLSWDSWPPISFDLNRVYFLEQGMAVASQASDALVLICGMVVTSHMSARGGPFLTTEVPKVFTLRCVSCSASYSGKGWHMHTCLKKSYHTVPAARPVLLHRTTCFVTPLILSILPTFQCAIHTRSTQRPLFRTRSPELLYAWSWSADSSAIPSRPKRVQ